jgi:hypothetical protein
MSSESWFQNFNDELSKRIDKVGRHIRDKIKESIDIPYPPPSAPGEPPHKRTGYLQRNVRFKREPFTKDLEIVSEAEYSSYLEHGTKKMAARPFMHPQLNIDEINNILND